MEIQLQVDRIVKDSDGKEVEYKAGEILIMDTERAKDYIRFKLGTEVRTKKKKSR